MPTVKTIKLNTGTPASPVWTELTLGGGSSSVSADDVVITANRQFVTSAEKSTLSAVNGMAAATVNDLNTGTNNAKFLTPKTLSGLSGKPAKVVIGTGFQASYGHDIWVDYANDIGAVLNTQITALANNYGGTIVLREGTYFIATPVQMKQGVNIVGQGDKTLITASTSTTDKRAFVFSNQTHKCRLENLSFLGSSDIAVPYIEVIGTGNTISGIGFTINSYSDSAPFIKLTGSRNQVLNCTNLQSPPPILVNGDSNLVSGVVCSNSIGSVPSIQVTGNCNIITNNIPLGTIVIQASATKNVVSNNVITDRYSAISVTMSAKQNVITSNVTGNGVTDTTGLTNVIMGNVTSNA